MAQYALMHKKQQEIDDLGLNGFPPIQKQRWNSVYITLNYIINNLDGLSNILDPEDNAIMIMDDLVELRNDLKPIYDFTTSCEIQNANQADLYIYYRSLKEQLITRMTPRANRLLEIVKSRFKSTLDIKISKLSYFTTNRGIKEKQERFPHVSAHKALKNEESHKKFDKEVELFEKNYKVIQQLYSKLGFDETLIFNSFETLLKFYFPLNVAYHQLSESFKIALIFQ